MFTGLDVKQLRDQLGEKQTYMAEKIGVSVQTIRHWEKHPELEIKKADHTANINALIEESKDKVADPNEKLVRESFKSKVQSNLAKIPFLREAVEVYFFAIDPKSPLGPKLLAFGALAYFISPFDAIPDFIPLTGFTDDAAVIATALLTLKNHITEEHKKRANKWLYSL